MSEAGEYVRGSSTSLTYNRLRQDRRGSRPTTFANSASERNEYKVRTVPSLEKQNCKAEASGLDYYIHENLCIALLSTGGNHESVPSPYVYLNDDPGQ
jgi:hypothetical protein